jgi:hypothetical protein
MIPYEGSAVKAWSAVSAIFLAISGETGHILDVAQGGSYFR